MPQDIEFSDLNFIIKFVYQGEINVTESELQVSGYFILLLNPFLPTEKLRILEFCQGNANFQISFKDELANVVCVLGV